MKKIFLTFSIILFSTVFALSSSMHDIHKGHGSMPFQKAMDKMHNALAPIDIDFLKGMIPHHQGAIDMAEELIKKTKDPELKALAQKIIKDQKAEIKQMQDMLKAKSK